MIITRYKFISMACTNVLILENELKKEKQFEHMLHFGEVSERLGLLTRCTTSDYTSKCFYL